MTPTEERVELIDRGENRADDEGDPGTRDDRRAGSQVSDDAPPQGWGRRRTHSNGHSAGACEWAWRPVTPGVVVIVRRWVMCIASP